MKCHVLLQAAEIRELLLTHVACKRPTAGMRSHVRIQIRCCLKLSLAATAGKWFFPGVCHNVQLQIPGLDKSLLANCTFKRLVVGMREHVNF